MTGAIGCAGGTCTLGPLAPGPCEIVAWCPTSRSSGRRTTEIAAGEPDWDAILRIDCVDSHSGVAGELRAMYDGRATSSYLRAWLTVPDAPERLSTYEVYVDSIGIESGRFELASLPPDVEFELRFLDPLDSRCVAARRKFRLAPGEQLDLGTIEVEIR
jgi:hypothetical protein